jgi:NADH-ubiquinone oxidoreductase chain 1
MIILFNILEILIVLVPVLMTVAFVTIAERKIMASMQRRCGPNAVGVWGLMQPFADALKLLVKEIVIPRQSNTILFVIGPCITLIFAFIGWAIIPFGEGLAIFDYELGVFFALAVSSIGSYGILISGWAANSKYAFMGAIRSTAQLLSYELVFSSIILILIIFSGSFSLTFIVECQQAVWNIFPLLPIALMFLIAILAETNRPPFDLPEAESELVAGFMTEHGSSIFVFFFLGEYSSLILMSAFMSIFFLGGHHCPDLHKLIYEPLIYGYYSLNSWVNNLVNYDYAINSYINDMHNNESKDIYGKDNINLNLFKDIVDSNKDSLNLNAKSFMSEYYKNMLNEGSLEADDLHWDKNTDTWISIYDIGNLDKNKITLDFIDGKENLNYIDEEVTLDIFNLINDGVIYVINFFRNQNNNKFFNSEEIQDINKEYITEFTNKDTILNTLGLLIDKVQGSYILGFKIVLVVFFYIWIRASFPRLRYDQLMSLCWKELLPLVFAYIIFTLCLFYTFDMIPFGTTF